VKNTVSLRISLTTECQFRCLYCTAGKDHVGDAPAQRLTVEEIVSFVRQVKGRFRIEKIHLTGGEPLLRSDIVELVRRLSRLGIGDIALTTNGERLVDRAEALRDAGLRRLNISLDSLETRMLARITRGGHLERIVAGIERAGALGLRPIKINTVVLRGVNDGELARLAEWSLGHGWVPRFLELMPIGPAKPLHGRLFVPVQEIMERLARTFTLNGPLPEAGLGSTRYYAAASPRAVGRIGFITPVTHPFCAGCNRLRLTEAGDLVSCLACGLGVNVRQWLAPEGKGRPDRFANLLDRVLKTKKGRGLFQTETPMMAVGG